MPSRSASPPVPPSRSGIGSGGSRKDDSDSAEEVYQFLRRLVPEEDKHVIADIARALVSQGLSHDWSVQVAPKELLLQLFPVTTKGQHLTIVLRAQQLANRSQTSIADQVSKIAKEQRALRRQQKGRSRSASSSASGDGSGKQGFNASACLKRYGMPEFPHEHLPLYDKLSGMAPCYCRLIGRQFTE